MPINQFAFSIGIDPGTVNLGIAAIEGKLDNPYAILYEIRIERRANAIERIQIAQVRIYRRSLTFLLAAAFEAQYAELKLTVDHSVSSGGYFCQVSGGKLSNGDLAKLEARMRELVEFDLPFAKSEVKLDEAVAYFRDKGYQDKAQRLAHRRKPTLVLYSLGKLRDYHHGYMVPPDTCAGSPSARPRAASRCSSRAATSRPNSRPRRATPSY